MPSTYGDPDDPATVERVLRRVRAGVIALGFAQTWASGHSITFVAGRSHFWTARQVEIIVERHDEGLVCVIQRETSLAKVGGGVGMFAFLDVLDPNLPAPILFLVGVLVGLLLNARGARAWLEEVLDAETLEDLPRRR